jgi:hypothetical protein
VSTVSRTGYLMAGAGVVLGVVAGTVQATIGSTIPTWSGNKADPVSLGVLTVALSLAGGAGLLIARRPHISPGAHLTVFTVITASTLVCFTTVGRLWLLPGALLLLGTAMTIDDWRDMGRAARGNWIRLLIATLGGCQLILAAGATATLTVVGGLSGLALIAAAVLSHRRETFAALMVLGTVPFGVLAWEAIAPLVVLLLIGALSVPILSPARTERAP